MDFQFYTQDGRRNNFKRGEMVTWSTYTAKPGVGFKWHVAQHGIGLADGRGTVFNTGVASGTFKVPNFTDSGTVIFGINLDSGEWDNGTFTVVD